MRKSCLSNRGVQFALLWHLFRRWCVFLFTVAVFLLFAEMVSGNPHATWSHVLRRYGPAILAVMVVSPIFAYDVLKFSNRFLGPMVRLRRSIEMLADGAPVQPLQFRKDDFWQDVQQHFGRLADRLQLEDGKRTTATTAPPDQLSWLTRDQRQIAELRSSELTRP